MEAPIRMVSYCRAGLSDDTLLQALRTLAVSATDIGMLDVSSNYLTAKFTEALTTEPALRALLTSPALRVVDLSNNYIDASSGLKHLCDALSALSVDGGSLPYVVVYANPCAWAASSMWLEELVKAQRMAVLCKLVWIPPHWLPGRQWAAQLPFCTAAQQEQVLDAGRHYWMNTQVSVRASILSKSYLSLQGKGILEIYRGLEVSVPTRLFALLLDDIRGTAPESVFLRLLGFIERPSTSAMTTTSVPSLLVMETAFRYEIGQTVKRNTVMARHWKELAAQAIGDPSIERLAHMFDRLTDEDEDDRTGAARGLDVLTTLGAIGISADSEAVGPMQRQADAINVLNMLLSRCDTPEYAFLQESEVLDAMGELGLGNEVLLRNLGAIGLQLYAAGDARNSDLRFRAIQALWKRAIASMK